MGVLYFYLGGLVAMAPLALKLHHGALWRGLIVSFGWPIIWFGVVTGQVRWRGRVQCGAHHDSDHQDSLDHGRNPRHGTA